MATINGIQLDMFKPYKLPHIQKWDTYYRGWRPKAGEIARINGFCHLKGEDITDDDARRYVGMMTGYLVAVNDTHVEIVLPFLYDAPWCKQQHLVAPLLSIEPEVSSVFEETAWRKNYPIQS